MFEKQESPFKEFPQKYPKVLAHGLPSFGLAVAPGWAPLLHTLCERLETILEAEPGSEIVVDQVKEKFGTLRFYYHLINASEETEKAIEDAVDKAEDASGLICESCGKPGETSGEGYILTLCPACRVKRGTQKGHL